MAKNSVLARAGFQRFVLLVKVSTVRQVVHGIVSRFLLVHRHYAARLVTS